MRLGLCARSRRPELFQHGAYVGLEPTGDHRDAVFAFARTAGPDLAVTLVPRRVTTVVRDGAPPVGADAWGNTRINLRALGEPRPLHNLLTGETVLPASDSSDWSVDLAQAFSTFPVALLVPQLQHPTP